MKLIISIVWYYKNNIYRMFDIKFTYDGKKIIFSSETRRKTLKDVVDWLHNNDEGKEPYCPFCNKQLDYGNDDTIKPYEVDEDEYPEDDDFKSNDESLKKLVRKILDTTASNLFNSKLEEDDIEEADPELISRIGNMIQMWHDQNR